MMSFYEKKIQEHDEELYHAIQDHIKEVPDLRPRLAHRSSFSNNALHPSSR